MKNLALSNSNRPYLDEYITFRGFSRSGQVQRLMVEPMQIVLGTLDAHTIPRTEVEHHLCYSFCKNLRITIPATMTTADIAIGDPLFRNLDKLTINFDSSARSLWEMLLDLCEQSMCELLSYGFCGFVRIRCKRYEIHAKQRAEQIASLVDLTTITKLEFRSQPNRSHLHLIGEVLL